jgi:hypothetical protein
MLPVFIFVAFMTFKVSAQTSCSLAVRVLSPDGQRFEVPITVREQSGRIVEKDQEQDDVRFCDLGILPVEVRVGSDGMCSQVTIHDVPVFLEKTYLLRVTYDPTACPDTLPPPVPVCNILFRISDTSANWIAGATVSISGPNSSQLKTDLYGRTQLVARVGARVRGEANADGFQRAKFAFECTKSQPLHEETIRLTRR